MEVVSKPTHMFHDNKSESVWETLRDECIPEAYLEAYQKLGTVLLRFYSFKNVKNMSS